MAAVAHKHVDFLEGTLVEQLCNAFAGGVFTFVVLFLDSLFASTEAGFFAQSNKLSYFFKLVTHFYELMTVRPGAPSTGVGDG